MEISTPQEKKRNGVMQRVSLRNSVETQDAGMQLGGDVALHSLLRTRDVSA